MASVPSFLSFTIFSNKLTLSSILRAKKHVLNIYIVYYQTRFYVNVIDSYYHN